MRPRRLQSKPPARAAHVFYDVTGFADYIAKFGSANTVILSSPVEGKMQAILDETSETGFELVTLQAVQHPLFTPWSALFSGEPISIKEFAEFVACNRRVISEPNGKDLALSCARSACPVRSRCTPDRAPTRSMGFW